MTPLKLEAAFRRCLARHKASHQSTARAAVQAARNALRSKGWTQADAAQVLGITPIHLCCVLNGRRESRRVLNAIHELPANPNPA